MVWGELNQWGVGGINRKDPLFVLKVDVLLTSSRINLNHDCTSTPHVLSVT